jgi:hypothetical protein
LILKVWQHLSDEFLMAFLIYVGEEELCHSYQVDEAARYQPRGLEGLQKEVLVHRLQWVKALLH